MGRTSGAGAFFEEIEVVMDVTIVTDDTGNTRALHIRKVPTVLLYLLKDAALKEGVTLRRYVIRTLALATSGDLGDLDIDYRE